MLGLLSIGASLLGGLMQGRAASKAADAQTAAADKQLGLQREIYDDTTNKLAPFLQGGRLGQDAYNYEMGLGNAPMIGGSAPQIETITTPGTTTQGGQGRAYGGSGSVWNAILGNAPALGGGGGTPGMTQYRVNGQMFASLEDAQAYASANPSGGRQFQGRADGTFQTDPGYQFAMDQGLDAVQSSAAARGGLYSGAAMAGVNDYAQGMANQQYGNWYQREYNERQDYLNRLQGIGANGQNAAGAQATAGTNYANGAGTALANQGNATAAGYIGRGNAFADGITNAIGAFQYGQTQQPVRENRLFGGNSWG